MQITEKAKKIIEKEFTGDTCNALELITRACPCCGRAFSCKPIRALKRTLRDEAVEINGIYVVMDDTTRRQSVYVTIDESEGELVIRDETPTSLLNNSGKRHLVTGIESWYIKREN